MRVVYVYFKEQWKLIEQDKTGQSITEIAFDNKRCYENKLSLSEIVEIKKTDR